jgi:hypothetical protein
LEGLGFLGQGAKDPSEVRRQQRVEHLAQPGIVACLPPEACLQERQHPTLLSPNSDLVERMMPVQKRQD